MESSQLARLGLVEPMVSSSRICAEGDRAISGVGKRGSDRRNRAEQNEWIALRRKEAPPLPELSGGVIDSVVHQCAAADQPCRMDAALEGMFDEAGLDSLPCAIGICGKLAEKEARNRVGRLAGADRTRQDRRHHGGRRQTIVSDNPTGIVNDKDGGKALLLIGQGPRLQPVIERGLAARELRNIMH